MTGLAKPDAPMAAPGPSRAWAHSVANVTRGVQHG